MTVDAGSQSQVRLQVQAGSQQGSLANGGLDRFLDAQAATYPAALAELRDGAKRGHWMWFIFPQIAGLGQSAQARYYAINDLAEAQAYLVHPLLGIRLIACTEAVLAWSGSRSARTILGSIDSQKFASCMTLFEAAGGGAPFARALDAFFAGLRDQATLQRLDQHLPR